MRGSDGMQETLFTVAKLQTIRKRIEEHFGWGKTIGRTVWNSFEKQDGKRTLNTPFVRPWT